MKKQFSTQFLGAVVTIKDGDGTPIKMIALSGSWNCKKNHAKKFGCKPHEKALLAEWVPMGMQYAQRKPGRLPKGEFYLAGAVGIGPTTKVLETFVIPLHHTPI